MMFYISIKYHGNIYKGFRIIEGPVFPYSRFSKGHYSVKNVRKVMVLVLCISSDDALYNFIYICFL